LLGACAALSLLGSGIYALDNVLPIEGTPIIIGPRRATKAVERTPQQETAKTKAVISEITYGRFEREFAVPDEVDADHVQATYRNGMLELTLPLKEGAKPRRIDVQAAPETAEVKQLHAA
jgi:Hsp20/alpha crystallin family